jgi:hypothetical protein
MLLMLLLLTIFDWGVPPLILACFFVLGYCLVNYCELFNGRKKSFFLPASRPSGPSSSERGVACLTTPTTLALEVLAMGS